jgi:hypothetical protein
MNYVSKFEFSENDSDIPRPNADTNAGGVNADIKELAAKALVQGTGKSTLFKLLAMGEEFFSDDFPLGGDAKQTIEQTRGKFLIECAELKGMRASDVTKVKSQLSRTHDYARLSYDRVATEVPRQFLLAGTTNNKKYLKDETGDRRFWPMETGKIQLSEITPELVEQLWAEAKVYAEAGEALVIDRSLWKVAAEEQSKRRFAAYAFLILERETIPPSGSRRPGLRKKAEIPEGYRPRGHAAQAGETYTELHRNTQTQDRRRPGKSPATMSMLREHETNFKLSVKLMTQ